MPQLIQSNTSDAILVLNAGSSSIKFSVFLVRAQDQALDLLLGGQIEGIYTEPRFAAKDAAGAIIDEQRWGRANRSGTPVPSPI